MDIIIYGLNASKIVNKKISNTRIKISVFLIRNLSSRLHVRYILPRSQFLPNLASERAKNHIYTLNRSYTSICVYESEHTCIKVCVFRVQRKLAKLEKSQSRLRPKDNAIWKLEKFTLNQNANREKNRTKIIWDSVRIFSKFYHFYIYYNSTLNSIYLSHCFTLHRKGQTIYQRIHYLPNKSPPIKPSPL